MLEGTLDALVLRSIQARAMFACSLWTFDSLLPERVIGSSRKDERPTTARRDQYLAFRVDLELLGKHASIPLTARLIISMRLSVAVPSNLEQT